MPIPVRVLVQHQTNLTTVSLETSLPEALALMTKHNYSQLPVVDKNQKPLGIITTTSIIRALSILDATTKDLHVRDVVTKVTPFKSDEDLLFLLDYLLSTSAGLVIDEEGKLVGIVTDYDTTQYFRQRAEDIVLVEDIESTLKSHLLTVYGTSEKGKEDLRHAIDGISTPVHESRKSSLAILNHFGNAKGVKSTTEELEEVINKHLPLPKGREFDKLTLSEYIQCAHKAWSKLSPAYKISQKLWTKMLHEVREIRNKLAHFRGEVSPTERAALRYCAEWFESHPLLEETSAPIDDIPTDTLKDPAIALKDMTESVQAGLLNQAGVYNNNIINIAEFGNNIKYKIIGLTLTSMKKEKPEKSRSIKLLLTTLERATKSPLPKAAREHISWWTDNSEHSRQWTEEGWHVVAANLSGDRPTVTFAFKDDNHNAGDYSYAMTS